LLSSYIYDTIKTLGGDEFDKIQNRCSGITEKTRIQSNTDTKGETTFRTNKLEFEDWEDGKSGHHK
jgi:hypothetical protein